MTEVSLEPAWYCPGCGTRYFGPGNCTNGHPATEVSHDDEHFGSGLADDPIKLFPPEPQPPEAPAPSPSAAPLGFTSREQAYDTIRRAVSYLEAAW